MTVFLISDTHFGHANMITKFVLADGTPARKFASVEEMDETMIERWNARIRPQDHVYHLGDVAMREADLHRVMPRLNGHKRLVRGNHDIFRTKKYMQYFDEIHGMRVLDGLILTHAPLAPWSHGNQRANVHGHVHTNAPRLYTVSTPREFDAEGRARTYVNLCVETTDYAPTSLEEVSSWVRVYQEQAMCAVSQERKRLDMRTHGTSYLNTVSTIENRECPICHHVVPIGREHCSVPTCYCACVQSSFIQDPGCVARS